MNYIALILNKLSLKELVILFFIITAYVFIITLLNTGTLISSFCILIGFILAIPKFKFTTLLIVFFYLMGFTLIIDFINKIYNRIYLEEAKEYHKIKMRIFMLRDK